MRIVVRLLRAVAWLAAVVLIALGVAGIAVGANHAPDETARPELFARGDSAVAPAVDAVDADLRGLQTLVLELAQLARTALVDLNGGDRAALSADLDAGDALVLEIGTQAASTATDLAALPIGPGAYRWSPSMKARIAAASDAVDAVRPLTGAWGRLSGGAVPAIALREHLTTHDRAAFTATQDGTAGRYAAAIDKLDAATRELDAARTLRDRLAVTTDTATLDAWIQRNASYDAALHRLYAALRTSKGRVSDAARAAFEDVQRAQELLPPDTRALVVIVSDVAQGGLNQAAIEIELVRGALAAALAAVD